MHITVCVWNIAHDMTTTKEVHKGMVSTQNVTAQLKRIGVSVNYWGAAEVRELQHILMPEEQLVNLINGRYENGFATLVATDRRLLLIDKKPLYLTIEDLRYDTVAEVDYSARLLDATIRIMTFNKTLTFTTIRQRRLRELGNFVQQRVMELRHHQFNDQFSRQENASEARAQISWVPQQAPAGVVPHAPMQLGAAHPYSRGSLTMKQHFLPKIKRTRY